MLRNQFSGRLRHNRQTGSRIVNVAIRLGEIHEARSGLGDLDSHVVPYRTGANTPVCYCPVAEIWTISRFHGPFSLVTKAENDAQSSTRPRCGDRDRRPSARGLRSRSGADAVCTLIADAAPAERDRAANLAAGRLYPERHSFWRGIRDRKRREGADRASLGVLRAVQ
jgi:hypothetical protein